MALSENKIIDKIEIVENGIVQVREATRIIKDGEVIAQTYHRTSIAPGENYSEQPDNVKAICDLTHTPQVIADYKALLEANLKKLG